MSRDADLDDERIAEQERIIAECDTKMAVIYRDKVNDLPVRAAKVTRLAQRKWQAQLLLDLYQSADDDWAPKPEQIQQWKQELEEYKQQRGDGDHGEEYVEL